MKRAAEKLKSSRGASLMMALLLFLTCAVVGSAVLTAGTAASGRMSKIAESDQRYYSVNSAANLLIDLLQDQTVTVRKVESSKGSGAELYYRSKDDTAFTKYESLTKATLPVEMAYLITSGSTDAELKLSSDDFPSDDLNPSPFADVRGKLSPEGKLEFTIVSAVKDSAPAAETTQKYTLAVTFAADKRETRSVELKDDETITTTDTSYTWKLSDVK